MKMQINTTMSCHYTPIRITKIKKTDHSQCWQGCGGIEALIHWWWECKVVQQPGKTVWHDVKTSSKENPKHHMFIAIDKKAKIANRCKTGLISRGH